MCDIFTIEFGKALLEMSVCLICSVKYMMNGLLAKNRKYTYVEKMNQFVPLVKISNVLAVDLFEPLH